jgi:hypothetical protein
MVRRAGGFSLTAAEYGLAKRDRTAYDVVVITSSRGSQMSFRLRIDPNFGLQPVRLRVQKSLMRQCVERVEERRRVQAMRRRVEVAHAVLVWTCVVLPLAAVACAGAWELGRAIARAAL